MRESSWHQTSARLGVTTEHEMGVTWWAFARYMESGWRGLLQACTEKHPAVASVKLSTALFRVRDVLPIQSHFLILCFVGYDFVNSRFIIVEHDH